MNDLVIRPRRYYESRGVSDLTTGFGDGGGGSVVLRYGGQWITSDDIERDADSNCKLLRWSVTDSLKRELARLKAIGPIARWLGRAESTPRHFAVTASLVLAEIEDVPDAGASLLVGFDLFDESSVDSAVAAYRQFVVTSMTAAIHTEQELAREASAGYWMDWEGS